MSERKVLNKYFPPDFDPKKIPGGGMGRPSQHTVRLMTPFSMRCNTCGEFIYKRKKFNARKEIVRGEDYLGIKIYRFYIKCPRCSAEITFKTDPQNADYIAEQGAQRNFEPWRDEKFTTEELLKEKQREEEANPMKALENKTFDSKREMELLDTLDEIRTTNARAERVNPDELLEKMMALDQKALDEERARQEAEDDEIAKSIFHGADGEFVRRILVDTPEELETAPVNTAPAVTAYPSFDSVFKQPSSSGVKRKNNDFGVLVRKKPLVEQKAAQPVKPDCNEESKALASANALSMLAAYGDSDNDN